MENVRNYRDVKLVKKELFSVRTKLAYKKMLLKKIVGNQNEKKRNNEQASLNWSIDFGDEEDSDV